jgi:hypothetical protein
MMDKQAQPQPMSPRTQAFSAGAPSGDEETRLFEQGFSDMAYNVMMSKFPDLVQSVVTFKVLDTDVETGAGIGAFVIQHDTEVIYIPVVMADNQIKPVDLFYHKGLNVFLPLNNEWLDEVSQLSMEEMGETVAPPKSLYRNVDTRRIMVPPVSGRFAYAAAPQQGPLSDLDALHQMLRKLEQTKTASDEPEEYNLLRFLREAPEQIKEAFHRVLTSRPHLAAQAAKLHGLDELSMALRKTASANCLTGGALYVAKYDTTSDQFKEVFGDKAPEAFQGALQKGYAAKDDREGLKVAVQTQEFKDLEAPTQSGFYKVYTTKGESKDALVIHNPRSIRANYEDKPEGRHGVRHDTLSPGQHSKSFITILNDGTWNEPCKLVGEPINQESCDDLAKTKLFKKLMNESGSGKPTSGARGIFVKKLGQTFVGTQPFRVKSITTDSKGVRRITCDDYEGTQLITDPKAAKAGMHQPKGANLMYIPQDATFIKLKGDRWDGPKFMENPTDVCKWMESNFDAMGAHTTTVKNAAAEQFSVDGEPPMDKIAAMEHLARKHNIHFESAEMLVKQAEAIPNGRATAYVVTEEMIEKTAQGPMMDPTAMQGGAPPPPGMEGDPAAMGAAPPPAPPSPLDIAMGEVMTQMQQQSMDLQQQQMALEDKANTLAMVGQRAQEIAQGGQAAVQQGAPPMPPMGGAPQDPAAAQQGAPPPQGAAPAPGGMPAPADQMTGGAGMSTGAAMTTETPSAQEIQQQVNPQFLEQAGSLNDTGAFDAATIASMSQSASFRDMVVDYVPTLERALDNLGRIMLSLWLQEGELKEQIGEEEYTDLEDNLRAVFEGLGSLVLQINRNAIVMDPTNTVA